MSRQSRPLAREDTGARGAAGAASRPKSLSQPAPETRTPAARAAKQVHTTFFSKTREMRSLTRCRRRQRDLYADGALHNGLREVDDARSSCLHASKVEGSHPDNFGFSGKILYILEKYFVCFGEKCCMIWRKILYVSDFGEKSCIKMSGTISRPSGAPTPPNLRFVIKYRNVSRIG